MPLFRRTTHGVTLTEAGRLLSNQAEGLLEKCDRALSLMRERNIPVQGSVRIACELEISYAAQIREFTARFSERYPDIGLLPSTVFSASRSVRKERSFSGYLLHSS